MEFKNINLVLFISLMAGTLSSSSSTLVRKKRWGDKGDTGDGSSLFRGTAGVDYPDLKTIPSTSFTCEDKIYDGGLYADIEASCQVYHVCQEGRKSSFLCGKGTIFNQQILTCDYWYSAQCDNAENFYHLNSQIGNANHHGFGISQKGSPYQLSGTGHGLAGIQPDSGFPTGPHPGSGHQPGQQPESGHQIGRQPESGHQTGRQPDSGHQTGLQPGSGYQTGSHRTQPGSGSRPGSGNPTGPHTGSQPGNGYPTGPHTGSQPGSGYPSAPHTGSQPGSEYPIGPHTGSQHGSGYPTRPQTGSQHRGGFPTGPQPGTVESQPGSRYQTSGSRPGIGGPQPGSLQKGGYKHSSSIFQAGNGPRISGPQPSSPGNRHSSSSSGTFRKTTTDQRSVPLPNRLPVGGSAGQNQVYPPNRAYDSQQNVQHTCECAQQSQNNPWSFPAGMMSVNADK